MRCHPHDSTLLLHINNQVRAKSNFNRLLLTSACHGAGIPQGKLDEIADWVIKAQGASPMHRPQPPHPSLHSSTMSSVDASTSGQAHPIHSRLDPTGYSNSSVARPHAANRAGQRHAGPSQLKLAAEPIRNSNSLPYAPSQPFNGGSSRPCSDQTLHTEHCQHNIKVCFLAQINIVRVRAMLSWHALLIANAACMKRLAAG